MGHTFSIGDDSLVLPRLTTSITVDSAVIAIVIDGAQSRMDNAWMIYNDSLVIY